MQQNQRDYSRISHVPQSFDAAVVLSILRASVAQDRVGRQSSIGAQDDVLAEYRFLQRTLVDQATLAKAATISAAYGRSLQLTLIDHGWVNEADYVRVLAAVLGLDVAAGKSFAPRPDHRPSADIVALDVGHEGQTFVVILATAVRPSDLAQTVAAAGANRRRILLATAEEMDRLQIQPIVPRMLQHAVFGLMDRDPAMSAYRSMTMWQGALLLSLGVALAMGVLLAPRMTLQTAFVAASIPILCMGLLRLLGLWVLFSRPKRKRRAAAARIPDRDLPPYTVLVALYREAEVLPRLVRSLSLLDYPASRLEVLLVMETDDQATQAAAASLDMPGNFRVVVVPHALPRTKPKALNYALGLARGRYVVVYDAEDRPEPDQLRQALAKFAGGRPDLACVQAALNTYNADAGFLTRQFTIEYTVLFDALLPALERLRLPLPLGGTSNHFAVDALRQVGAWDPHNVTEDADLGIRLARAGYSTGTIASTTWEEAPQDFANWLPQRTRWLKGWMQTYLVHLRQPLLCWRQLGTRGFLGVQVLMAGILLSVLVYPWTFVLLALDLWSGHLWRDIPTLSEQLIWGLAALNFAVGILSTAGVGAYAVWRRGWRRLALSAIVMPVYWLLLSVAGYRALLQLIRKPHLWEKTKHGGG